jgi:hypothetical protein
MNKDTIYKMIDKLESIQEDLEDEISSEDGDVIAVADDALESLRSAVGSLNELIEMNHGNDDE